MSSKIRSTSNVKKQIKTKPPVLTTIVLTVFFAFAFGLIIPAVYKYINCQDVLCIQAINQCNSLYSCCDQCNNFSQILSNAFPVIFIGLMIFPFFLGFIWMIFKKREIENNMADGEGWKNLPRISRKELKKRKTSDPWFVFMYKAKKHFKKYLILHIVIFWILFLMIFFGTVYLPLLLLGAILLLTHTYFLSYVNHGLDLAEEKSDILKNYNLFYYLPIFVKKYLVFIIIIGGFGALLYYHFYYKPINFSNIELSLWQEVVLLIIIIVTLFYVYRWKRKS